jgi:hypothetical protein
LFGHNWEHGTAKVIDKSLMPSGSATSSVPGRYRYVVEVQNPTGEAFRGEIQDSKFRVEGYVVSQVGDEVAVLVDYKRQKVKLDKHDPSRHRDPRAIQRAADDKFAAELAGTPGTTPDQASPQADPGSPRITIGGKTFDGPMDKAEIQKALSEAGKSPEREGDGR